MLTKRVKVQKDDWNVKVVPAGPFWYIIRGMLGKGLPLLVIALCTVGIGIIPAWIYCVHKANGDFYTFLKDKNYYIYYIVLLKL